MPVATSSNVFMLCLSLLLYPMVKHSALGVASSVTITDQVMCPCIINLILLGVLIASLLVRELRGTEMATSTAHNGSFHVWVIKTSFSFWHSRLVMHFVPDPRTLLAREVLLLSSDTF